MRYRSCTNAVARDCGSLKLWRTGHGFRLKKVRIGYIDRPDFVVRNDHARAALREMPEANGKVIFKRMQPCDAGCPGTTPACNAIPDQVMRCM